MAELDIRLNYWNDNLKQKFNLDYTEHNNDDGSDGRYPDGWFGTIEGDGKDINWFLLQL